MFLFVASLKMLCAWFISLNCKYFKQEHYIQSQVLKVFYWWTERIRSLGSLTIIPCLKLRSATISLIMESYKQFSVLLQTKSKLQKNRFSVVKSSQKLQLNIYAIVCQIQIYVWIDIDSKNIVMLYLCYSMFFIILYRVLGQKCWLFK